MDLITAQSHLPHPPTHPTLGLPQVLLRQRQRPGQDPRLHHQPTQVSRSSMSFFFLFLFFLFFPTPPIHFIDCLFPLSPSHSPPPPPPPFFFPSLLLLPSTISLTPPPLSPQRPRAGQDGCHHLRPCSPVHPPHHPRRLLCLPRGDAGVGLGRTGRGGGLEMCSLSPLPCQCDGPGRMR